MENELQIRWKRSQTLFHNFIDPTRKKEVILLIFQDTFFFSEFSEFELNEILIEGPVLGIKWGIKHQIFKNASLLLCMEMIHIST